MVPLFVKFQPSGLHRAVIIEVVAASVVIGVPAGHRCSVSAEAVGNIIVVRSPCIRMLLTCDVEVIEFVVH